jgi:hypothetical protein
MIVRTLRLSGGLIGSLPIQETSLIESINNDFSIPSLRLGAMRRARLLVQSLKIGLSIDAPETG